MPRRNNRPRVRPLALDELATLAVEACIQDDNAISGQWFIDAEALEAVAETQRDAAVHGTLIDVAVALVKAILTRQPLRNADNVLLASKALDLLAKHNDHVVAWRDADVLYDLEELALARHDQLDANLAHWLGRELERLSDDGAWEPPHTPTPTTLRAFVGGPTTGLPPDVAEKVKALTRAATAQLRRLGYLVYDPVSEPDADSTDQDITARDLDELAETDLLVVIVVPPALGVGMLLAYSDRHEPYVLIVGDAGSDVTPLTACQAHRSDMKPIADPDTLAQVISDAVRDHRAEIEAHARQRSAREATYADDFFRFRRSHQSFALGRPAVAGVPAWRVEQIAGSIAHFATATLWELNLIAAAYGLPPFTLTDPANDAGQSTARDDGPHAVDGELALFDLPNQPQTPRTVVLRDKQTDWEDIAWLSVREHREALNAAQAMGLSLEQAATLIDAAASIRAEEHANAVGLRLRTALLTVEDWIHLWTDALGHS